MKSSPTNLYSCVFPSKIMAPKLFQATSTSATLRWNVISEDGGCDITGFNIYRNDGAGGLLNIL